MTARSLLYAGSFVTLLLATAFTWRRCQPAVDAVTHERDLDVIDLAALTGGGRLAAITAMASLRRSQVRTDPGGTMLADGPLDEEAGELERELYQAVRGSPATPASALVQGAANGAAATRLVARLRAAGLLLDARAAVCMHVLLACAAVLVGFGVLSLLDDLDDLGFFATLATPIGGLVAAAATLLWWIHSHRSGASAAGRRLISRIGDAGEGLGGRSDPGAFEVAMFGAGVLWTQDWALATALGLPAMEEEGNGWLGEILSFVFDFDGDGGGCGCG